MEKKKVIELATVNCSRISVYKKPLKTSREEMATIYVGEKFIDNVMPDRGCILAPYVRLTDTAIATQKIL